MNRRDILYGFGACTIGGIVGGTVALQALAADRQLKLLRRNAAILPDTVTEGLMAFGDAVPAVLRLPRGRDVSVDVTNSLREASTIHWHGLRVMNAQDGVPFVTQPPILDGATHRYVLNSPDAGTFWMHPHCNTIEQMSRGLSGIVIVDEDEPLPFDLDLPVLLRDFRLDGEGRFIAFSKPRNASRGGTLGTVSTANWQTAPRFEAPAGGLVRLRLVIADVTRIYHLQLSGAEHGVIAIDGHPLAFELNLSTFPVGPGQRVDLAVLMPERAGDVVTLTRRAANSVEEPVLTLSATGKSRARRMAELPPLPSNPLNEPDLAAAETVPFLFGWSPGGAEPVPTICGTPEFAFWSINRVAWSDDQAVIPEPAARLKFGRSYILRLMNETPNDHPIHLHGLAFKLLRSSIRYVPPLWTDTALLLSKETMEVALVADNPGQWAFHCHVIEHQKTGLTGYLTVDV
ncbi:MAG: multicopper oxidase family protein [Phyllobacteriaceae bacterium]|nr:multicopper oxidase family protein [Phyllobacteriaceae bacterium]